MVMRMAAPVARDQELELRIDSLAYGGNGVARLNGFVVFVRRGLPGDTVRARVTKVKRNHAEAESLEVVEAGAPRVEAPCAHYPACGGCRFQDLAYEAQLEAKAQQVGDAPDPPQRVRDLLRLGIELRLVGEVLEAAAPAGRVVRARRLHAGGARLHDLDCDGLGMAALHLRDSRAHDVPGKRPVDEDDKAVQAGDAPAAVGERVDTEVDLLVLPDRRGHV